MKPLKIAFFGTQPHDTEFFDRANATGHFEISYFKERLDLRTCALAQGHDAVCLFVNDAVNAEMVDSLVRCGIKIIALRCTGYNQIDLKAARGKIAVVNVPKYSPHSVAEFAVGLMLSLNRKIHHSYSRARANNFCIDGLMGFDMYQKKAGVIGAGSIGKRVIALLKGFGMQVYAFDVDRSQVEQAGCPYVELEDLYRQSDILTLHCPLTSDNVHMINTEAFGKMKEGVMLVNTGRGGLIDGSSLIAALKSRKVGAAGLDVYEKEGECFYRDHSMEVLTDDTLARLQSFPNVLITSHHAFFTKEALEAISKTTLESLSAFFEGKPLEAVAKLRIL